VIYKAFKKRYLVMGILERVHGKDTPLTLTLLESFGEIR
jgi:hypothetical protein